MKRTLTSQLDTAQAARKDGDNRVHVSLHHLLRLRHQATGYSFLPQQPVHSVLAGRYASRLRGRGLNFEEIRRYLPGDDLRAMDWKVTARTRKPHVRVYTEERDRAVLLVVDQRVHMFFGSRDRMKSVVAAECAALAAWRALDVGDRVGAIVFNDQEIQEIRPQRSKATVMAILQAMVRMNHQLRADSPIPTRPEQLNDALEKAGRLARHDHLVIPISDFLGVDANTTRWTTRLARQNDVLGILTFDPLRENPPAGGGQGAVTDGRLQLELDFGNATLRRRIAEDYRREHEAIRTALRKLSAPLLPIRTEGEVVDQLRRILGARP